MKQRKTTIAYNSIFVITLILLPLISFENCNSLTQYKSYTTPNLFVSYKGREYKIYQRTDNSCDSLLSIYLEDNLSRDNCFEGVFHADVDFILKDGVISDISVSCTYMPDSMKTHIASAIKNLKIRSSTTELVQVKVHVKIDLYNYTSQIHKEFFTNHGITKKN